MKKSYYFITIFLSFEFAAIIASFIIYLTLSEKIKVLSLNLALNQDALKWLMLYPIALAVWTFKDGVEIIFPSDKLNKHLIEWPDYWKLKAHFNSGVFYSIISSCTCLLVWLTNTHPSFIGGWIFTTAIVVASINSFSFFYAKLTIKEALSKIKNKE